MTQQDFLFRNNGASTSDWIGQAKGRIIYAYDVSALIAGSESAVSGPTTAAPKLEDYEPGITREEGHAALRKVARSTKR